MYALHFQKIDEWISRFEVLAGFLSHRNKRCLDFQAIAETSGYADHLLRDTAKKVGERLKLMGRTTDHEGTWYFLRVDPFVAPAESDGVVADQTESQMERLYRECCDGANVDVRKVILKLDRLRKQVQPAVGALVMDAVVDLSRLSILLTQISAAGVKGDRRDYIEGVRDRVQDILRSGHE
jgi:hypothetical protein